MDLKRLCYDGLLGEHFLFIGSDTAKISALDHARLRTVIDVHPQKENEIKAKTTNKCICGRHIKYHNYFERGNEIVVLGNDCAKKNLTERGFCIKCNKKLARCPKCENEVNRCKKCARIFFCEEHRRTSRIRSIAIPSHIRGEIAEAGWLAKQFMLFELHLSMQTTLSSVFQDVYRAVLSRGYVIPEKEMERICTTFLDEWKRAEAARIERVEKEKREAKMRDVETFPNRHKHLLRGWVCHNIDNQCGFIDFYSPSEGPHYTMCHPCFKRRKRKTRVGDLALHVAKKYYVRHSSTI